MEYQTASDEYGFGLFFLGGHQIEQQCPHARLAQGPRDQLISWTVPAAARCRGQRAPSPTLSPEGSVPTQANILGADRYLRTLA
jgi:hypothetical protein